MIHAAVASGARGLVLKSSPIDHLAGAIRAAGAGQDHVDRLRTRLPGREPASATGSAGTSAAISSVTVTPEALVAAQQQHLAADGAGSG